MYPLSVFWASILKIYFFSGEIFLFFTAENILFIAWAGFLSVSDLQKLHKSNWNSHKYCKSSFPYIIIGNFPIALFCHYVFHLHILFLSICSYVTYVTLS